MSVSLPFGEPARSASILVVDDEPDVAEVSAALSPRDRPGNLCDAFRCLGRGGVGSACRGNPPHAHRGSLRHQHAAHGWPGLLAEIRQRFPDLPVMMVTAYGDDDRRRRARELGAFEFLPKPVDFDHLKAQLRQLPDAAH